MAYRVVLRPNAERALRKLDPSVSRRIARRIERLTADPRPADAKHLKGEPAGVLRVRIGHWRLLYRVDDGRLTILVIDLGSKVYERWRRRYSPSCACDAGWSAGSEYGPLAGLGEIPQRREHTVDLARRDVRATALIDLDPPIGQHRFSNSGLGSSRIWPIDRLPAFASRRKGRSCQPPGSSPSPLGERFQFMPGSVSASAIG